MGEKRHSQHDAHAPNQDRGHEVFTFNNSDLSDEKHNRNRRLANKKRDRERVDDDLLDMEIFEDDDETDYLRERKKKSGKKKRRKDRDSDAFFWTDDANDGKGEKRRRKGRRAQQEWSIDDD